MAATATSGIQYFPTCRLQCLQAENFCGEKFACDEFVEENCMIYLPSGYFLLEPDQGPYDILPITYGICLGGWIIIALSWHYGAFYLYKDSPVIMCKAVSTLPLVKVGVLVLGTSFWTTCQDWMMCSFWLGVSLLNLHLVYETGLVICFLLIAMGWSITRDNFSPLEWRVIIISMSSFYMTNSIILVLDSSSVLTTRGYWIACTILYGAIYTFIVMGTIGQLRVLKDQVDVLRSAGDVPDAIGGPLHEKYYMYLIFLALVFCNIVLEISLHALLHKYGRMWIVLTIYEIFDLIICGLVFFIFRPREYSPFFFMAPATLNDNRIRPIPIIEALDDDKESAEIEVAPLLGAHSRNSRHHGQDKMVIIRNPSGNVVVGMSAVMQTRSHHGGGGSRPLQRDYVAADQDILHDDQSRGIRGLSSLFSMRNGEEPVPHHRHGNDDGVSGTEMTPVGPGSHDTTSY